MLHSKEKLEKHKYHYLVIKSGEVVTCHDDSETIVNVPEIDGNTIHIGIEGDFEKELLMDEQFKPVVGLLREKMNIYNLQVPRVVGHNESQILYKGRMITSCPGHLFPLRAIRTSLVKNRM